jgi:hypothetical protein
VAASAWQHSDGVKTRRADRTGSRYTQKRSRRVAVLVSRDEAGVKAAAAAMPACRPFRASREPRPRRLLPRKQALRDEDVGLVVRADTDLRRTDWGAESDSAGRDRIQLAGTGCKLGRGEHRGRFKSDAGVGAGDDRRASPGGRGRRPSSRKRGLKSGRSPPGAAGPAGPVLAGGALAARSAHPRRRRLSGRLPRGMACAPPVTCGNDEHGVAGAVGDRSGAALAGYGHALILLDGAVALVRVRTAVVADRVPRG